MTALFTMLPLGFALMGFLWFGYAWVALRKKERASALARLLCAAVSFLACYALFIGAMRVIAA